MKYWLLLLFLICLPLTIADSLDLQIEEIGKITNYLNTYWVVQVEGSGTLTNPTVRDIFDIRLYFDILGLDLIDDGGDGSFEGDSLKFDRLAGGETATFSYTIVGITAEPPALSGKGVLYTGLAKRTPRIYSDVFGELQKAPLEEKSITGRDARLISVSLTNPTSFEFTLESLRVIKTPSRNPNAAINEWNIVDSSEPRILDPDGFFVHDFIDSAAFEGEVYWLQSEVYISDVNLIDLSNVTRITEKNLTIPVEALNFTNITDANITRNRVTSIYQFRKQISESLIIPGEPVTVTLLLYNLGETLKKFSATDSLPSGFYANTDLSWTGEVPGRGTKVIQYQAVLNDTQTIGYDQFPVARALIDGKELTTQSVPFIRQFIPDEKLYVQKSVQYQDNDQVLVTISVQNLGKQTLSGATLKELIGEQDMFSQISVQPVSKGVWEVPYILPGDSWEVSYITEEGPSIVSLPMLYGIPASSVLRSIVLENVVNEAWEFVRTKWIEFAGILVLVTIPLLLLFGKRLSWFQR